MVLLLRLREQSRFVQLSLGEDCQVDWVGRELRFPGEVVAGSARVRSSVGRLQVLGVGAAFYLEKKLVALSMSTFLPGKVSYIK